MHDMKMESPQNDIIKEYTRLASTYDTKWPFYIEATTRATIARLTLHAADRLLDIGCGTGILLQRLSVIHPVDQLVGVDPVPGMLATARRRLSPEVRLYGGWAEQLPFTDAQFDIVVSSNMFHYIDRPGDALAEMRRVLRPGGQLVITDWCGDYLACRMFEQYQRLRGRAHAQIYRARDCMRLVKEAGYDVVKIDAYKINWYWGLMTAVARNRTNDPVSAKASTSVPASTAASSDKWQGQISAATPHVYVKGPDCTLALPGGALRTEACMSSSICRSRAVS